MQRRLLLKSILAFSATVLATTKVQAKENYNKVQLQTSAVAGYQYYQGEDVWNKLKVADELTLIPEPDNKYDDKAIQIYWQEYKLGYLPRDENYTINKLLKNNNQLTVKISKLQKAPNPWSKIEITIFLET